MRLLIYDDAGNEVIASRPGCNGPGGRGVCCGERECGRQRTAPPCIQECTVEEGTERCQHQQPCSAPSAARQPTAGDAPSAGRSPASTTPGTSTSAPTATAHCGAPAAARPTSTAPACSLEAEGGSRRSETSWESYWPMVAVWAGSVRAPVSSPLWHGIGREQQPGPHADEPDHGQGGHRQRVGSVPGCQVGHQDGPGDGGPQRRAQVGDAARQP
jgi:hypothetical protein